MANNKYDNLSQIDYCFRQYYSKYMASTLAKESANLRMKQEKEFNNTVGHYNMPASTIPTQMIATGTNLRLSGEWNSKTSDYLIDKCKRAWGKDGKMAEDIQTFLCMFYSELVRLNGGKETPELKAFTMNYMENRLEGLMVEQLARQKVPRNSAEYIAKRTIEDSLAGLVLEVGPRKGTTDDSIAKKAEDIYNPNGIERATAIGGSMLIDAAMTGGYGSGLFKTAKGVILDGFLRTGLEVYNARSWNNEKYQKEDSETVFGDEDAIRKIQKGGNNIKKGDSNLINAINSSLNKKVIGKTTAFTTSTKQEGNRVYTSSHGNAQSLLTYIRNNFSRQAVPYNGNTAIPSWMLQKSKDECMRNASAFYSIAINMSKKQQQEVMAGGKKMTFKEVSQRAYDYARAAEEISKTTKHQEKATGKQDSWDKEMAALNSQINNTRPAGQPIATTNTPYTTSASQQGASASTQSPQQQKKEIDGWGNAIEQLGLEGFSNVAKNMGYVLAMLPDMLIGMFTGKNPNMKLQDNLMPVAAIVGGLFIKNPLLKMLLMGFGGANLLNNAGHAALEQGYEKIDKKPVRYKQYADETLDQRIENPVMKGRSMLATIDGRPCVVNVSTEIAEAYEQGAVPLNTLANAVLRKHDENQALAEHSYERQMSESDTMSYTRRI